MVDGVLTYLGVPPSPQAYAAVIQGVVNFVGILATGLIAIFTWKANKRRELDAHEAEIEKDRKQAAMLRAARHEDLLRALRAEIEPVTRGLHAFGGAKKMRADLARAFDVHGEGYTPLIFDLPIMLKARLIEELDVLKSDEIGAVVEFYHKLSTINTMIAETRSVRFGNLGRTRKEQILGSLFELYDVGKDQGEAALAAIEAALTHGITRHEAVL